MPPLSDGSAARTVVLAGNVGPSMWDAFAATDRQDDHPLEAWSRAVLEPIAASFGGMVVYPFGGPPYQPFMRWAQRAGPIHPSKIGMLIHPDFGLWHAYRGAVLLPDRLELPARDERPRPCDSCPDKPCLTACPVNAFSAEGYDVPGCVAFVDDEPNNDCASHGCAARRACPVGRDVVYAPDQAAFHMAAFVRANQAR